MPPHTRLTARLWIGPALWVLCLQFFVSEFIVGRAWPSPYSMANNYISDLGSVHCAVLHGISAVKLNIHPVCSPLHSWMNGSFVMLGFLVAAGTLLTGGLFPAGKLTRVALALFVVTGIGYMLVGFAPNDVNLPVHYGAAAVSLFGQNIGMILLGIALSRSDGSMRVLGYYTLLSGILALTATFLLAANVDLGLGIGGIERVAIYPFLFWLIATGMHFLWRTRD